MKRLFRTLVIIVFCCQNIFAEIVINNTADNSSGFLIDNISLSAGAADSVEMLVMSILDIELDMTIPQDTLVTCWGDSSSGITVIATGGTGPGTYIYYIPGISSTPQASPTFLALFPGTYTIFVEDLNGSIDNVDVTINQPDSLEVTYTATPAECYGESTGMIDVQVLPGSGIPPYAYSWSGPNLFTSSSQNISSLVAGIYILEVTDGNKCIEKVPIVVGEPADLNQIDGLVTSNYNSYHIACKGDNSGWIKLEITGGYSPFTYAWNTGDTTASISNLSAGIYSVTITDGLGCFHVNDYPLLEPPTNLIGMIQTTTDYNGFNISCFNSSDGGIREIPSGGVPPYYWVWNGIEGTEYLINQKAGHYYVELYDDNNCFWDDSITLSEPPPLDIQKMSVTDTCDRAVGEAYANVSGGAPLLGTTYQYQWNSGDTSNIAVGLNEGNYNLIVTDGNGCVDTALYEIANLMAPLIDFYTLPERRRYYDQRDNPFFFIDVSNTYWQHVVDWQWDFGDNTFGEDSIASHSYAEMGEYTVLLTIKTQYNCWDTISKKILIDEYTLYIPNAFTPFTGDVLNAEFKASGYGVASYIMKIYNRWGGMLFESDDINRGWDGTISNGQDIAPIGTYLYYIAVENIYGEIFKYEGKLDLIR